MHTNELAMPFDIAPKSKDVGAALTLGRQRSPLYQELHEISQKLAKMVSLHL